MPLGLPLNLFDCLEGFGDEFVDWNDDPFSHQLVSDNN